MLIKEIQSTLTEMAGLLRSGSYEDSADVYESLAQRVFFSPDEINRRILASYGGMGSINDVCLVRNGEVLQTENMQFASLRTHLHALCLQHLASLSPPAK